MLYDYVVFFLYTFVCLEYLNKEDQSDGPLVFIVVVRTVML